jgi:alkylation response protein AidB-like acyl-CoA dehydrogenase
MAAFLSRRDIDFLLYEFLDTEALVETPRYGEHARSTFDSIIDTAFRVATECYAPVAAKIDRYEPRFDGSRVETAPELRTALDSFVEAGFMGASFDHDDGGLQLPYVVALACSGIFAAANLAANNYAFLTQANANLLAVFATPAQKSLYMRPMVEGRFFGTMCLSEPHAGSSLADIRMRADPAGDGSYRLRGSKMWISAGEHELAENIVHLVLARIPGAPAGAKGISLFLVPKFLVDETGKQTKRNDVRLAGLNEKLGVHGTTNCFLAFGDHDDCVGYLVGAPNEGLRCMFRMMNEARIAVGLGAATTAYAAYLHALDYARERTQGRPVGDKDPTALPVPILRHADVRRMLLKQKAIAEGSLALCLYAASLVDVIRTAGSDQREEAELLLDLLTPMVKSWPSERGMEANSLAIQVLGGAGYTREHPVERLYRDQRLNPIHEGTTGIQGLDLLGRKIAASDGRGLQLLVDAIERTVDAAREIPALAESAAQMAAAVARLQQTSGILRDAVRQSPEAGLADATLYLDFAGTIVVAWIWLRQALAAAASAGPFEAGKIAACRYFFAYELPSVLASADILERGKPIALEIGDDEF